MKNKQILNLLYKLGLELTNYDHRWTDDLRKEYEEVTDYLSSYIHKTLAENFEK